MEAVHGIVLKLEGIFGKWIKDKWIKGTGDRSLFSVGKFCVFCAVLYWRRLCREKVECTMEGNLGMGGESYG